MADMIGIDRRENKSNPNYLRLLTGDIPSLDKSISNWTKYGAIVGQLKDSNGKKSIYNREKYAFLLDAPFNISAKCCTMMKKTPAHSYIKSTGRMPITAQMASESRLRTQTWLKNGCNGFHMKAPISNPMSFWTEQDVLFYIYLNNLPICSVYGDIVLDKPLSENCDWKSTIDSDMPKFCTTGVNRTGCMFCGYGCHLEKPGKGRFELMKKTHPQIYDYIMRPLDEGGLDYKNKIDWINEHGNLNIKY